MRVEVWSPEGIEAQGIGDLTEIRAAQNSDAVALMDADMGIRVWLEADEVAWLFHQLVDIVTGSATTDALRRPSPSTTGEGQEGLGGPQSGPCGGNS